MSIFDYKESIITQRRAGNDTDPFVPIVRNIMIKNGLVQLPEIPSEFQKVKVTGNNENWFEIVNGTPIGNQYKVSYLHGYVEFDPIHDGKILTFEFMGTGNTYISVERIWLSFDGEKVTKTLGDLISSGESALEGLERLDEKIQETDQAINNANIAADNANQATNRVDDAINRANQISDTVSQEEQVRITNEVTRQTNESERVINEDTRKANEQDRINAEIERSNNEVDRIDEENIRIINEQARESNEALRVQREQDRVNEENIRISNEQNRVFAESERVSNEDIREQNEQTRISNENIRQTNEQDRINRYNNFAYLGEYDNTITYQPYNIISWQGSSYMCVQPSIGNLPLDNNYWKLLSRKGDKGATLTPKGVYNNTTLYEVNDLVTYDLGVYYCIQQSVGNDPTNTDYWALFLAGGGDMQREIYDTNFDGIVDNAERLGGQPPSYFAKQSDLETVQGSINNINNDISIINTNISTINQNITTLQTDTSQLRTDVDNNTNQINTLSNRVTTIESELSDQQELTTTLKYGSQVIEVPRDTPFNVLSLKGRTLVNLLGKDGNCEDTSKFTPWYSSTLAIDTNNKVFGTSSIKATSTNGTEKTCGISKNVANIVKSNSYYILSAYVKNVDLVNNKIEVLMRSIDSGGDRLGGNFGGDINSSQFTQIFGKFNTLNNVTDAYIYVRTIGGTTDVGKSFCVDGISLYEVSLSDYNSFDSLTQEQKEAMYPYVDSVQAVQNPYVIRRSRNLIPPFTEWNLHTNARVVEPYKLELNATGAIQISSVNIPVLPNTIYVLSATLSANATIGITYFDANGNVLAGQGNPGSGWNLSTNPSGVFTTPSSCVKIRVQVYNLISSGTFTFTNPMLNIGSTALPFEPIEEDYLFLETKLHSSVDGTVYDELIPTDTGYEKFARFREVVLDENLNWSLNVDRTGFKHVITSPQFSLWRGQNTSKVVKYDGKMLAYDGTANSFDTFVDYWSGSANPHGTLGIAISDSDSGWGENYTPTTDEIKAYFLGWRMFVWNSDPNVPYNGTGIKAWGKIYCGVGGNDNGVVSGSATQTLPTTMNDQGYVPYRLIYQLATPVREALSCEGSVLMKKGSNIIELGSGVILKERVTPLRDTSGIYRINSNYQIPIGSTWLKYAAKRIFNIYRNGQPDPRWSITNDRTPDPAINGTAEARLYDSSDFDPTAVYEVTYLVLDKYLFTTNPIDLQSSYQANLNEIVGKTVEKQANLETKVSVIENTYARKEQMPWITPTLLNGWVNYGGGFSEAGYFKDVIGIVHLKGVITGGSGTMFKLPVGYRPKTIKKIVTISNDGISEKLASVNILPDGSVNLDFGSNTWFTLDGISFRVE